jgi:hypothetical protein
MVDWKEAREGARMGRIVDLCGDVAAAAEEGPDGLLLPVEAWDRLRADWSDEDIEDADSLSARLVELLGTWAEPRAWQAAVAGHANVTLDVMGQLARRVDRVEEILDLCREGQGPDRRGFDALRQRLINQGIEQEMARDDDPGATDEPDED